MQSVMSAKAKAWMHKIDSMKDTQSNHDLIEQVPCIPEADQESDNNKEQRQESKNALFVSALDDRSTFEMASKIVPKGDDSIFDLNFEDETLFEFKDESEDAKRSSSAKRKVPNKSSFKQAEVSSARSNFLEATKTRREARNSKRRSRGRPGSDTSLIVDDSFSEITTPSDVSSGRQNNQSFLSRLNACAAPIIDHDDDKFQQGEGVPQAHLDFLLQKSPSCLPSSEALQEKPSLMNMLTGQNLCGNTTSTYEPESSPAVGKLRGSVASTYLDAIKKKDQSFSGSKSITSASSASKSETWQKFLDKRQKSLSSNRSQTSDVSKAAEQYAARKVSDIIDKISNENNQASSTVSLKKDTSPESMLPSNASEKGVLKSGKNRPHSVGRQRFGTVKAVGRSAAAKAAEDLAAARVEAMMSAMSTSKFDESEI